jgi:hypothetical protein
MKTQETEVTCGLFSTYPFLILHRLDEDCNH